MIEKELETYLKEKLSSGHMLTQPEKDKLFEERGKAGKRFIDVLPCLEGRSRVEVLKLISEFYRISFLDLDQIPSLDPETIKLIPEKLIRYFKVLPIKKEKNVLTMAMIDPLDVVLLDRLGQYAKCEISPVFSDEEAILRKINQLFGTEDHLGKAIRGIGGDGGSVSGESKDKIIGESTQNAPAVNIVNLLIEKALENHASDIHLEPAEKALYVRYRIDGVLYDYSPLPPKSMESSIISRIKIMANMDIAEKRLPQDGRIQYQMKDRDVNLRISTFPTIYGENVVIRVLDRSESVISLEDLGMQQQALIQFEKILQYPHGIILVTGPTGSGKTSTLYACLNRINSVEKHIITLEDPVESRLERVRQSQIDLKSGLTFAKGLRSIMRQDPDVIMIGEIRDLETATIAIQAALTGHLVLSTLHTNDAPAAITRLLDMGVEPFLISSSLSCVIAQRLVRKLCTHCRKPYLPEKALLMEVSGHIGAKNVKSEFYEKVGCDRCKGTGYQGRTGIFEFMVPTDDIRASIVKKESAEVIKRKAIALGMKTLKEEGLLKAQQGVSTIDEVLRVTQDS